MLIFAVGVCALIFISGCTTEKSPAASTPNTASQPTETRVNVVEQPNETENPVTPENNSVIPEENTSVEKQATPEPGQAETFAFDIHGDLKKQTCSYQTGVGYCKIVPLEGEVIATAPISFDLGKAFIFDINESSILYSTTGSGNYSLPVNPGSYSVFAKFNGKWYCRFKTDGNACLVTVANKSTEYSIQVSEITY